VDFLEAQSGGAGVMATQRKTATDPGGSGQGRASGEAATMSRPKEPASSHARAATALLGLMPPNSRSSWREGVA
jgi:hypothetical protein